MTMAGQTHMERLESAGRDADVGRESLLTGLDDDAFVAALAVDPVRVRQMKRALFRLDVATAAEVAAFASVSRDEAERYLDSRGDVCAPSGPPGAPGRSWAVLGGAVDKLRDEIRDDPAVDPDDVRRDRERIAAVLVDLARDVRDAETGDPDASFAAWLGMRAAGARRALGRLAEAGLDVEMEAGACAALEERVRSLGLGQKCEATDGRPSAR